MRVFRYLFSHKLALLIVFSLLICQAMCDLALPILTSNIVDVGIQQSGVEHITTDKMSAKTHSAVEAMLSGESSEQKAQLEEFSKSYDKEDGVYKLNDYGRAHIKDLDEMLEFPLVAIHGGGVLGSTDVDLTQMIDAYDAGTITSQQLSEYAQKARAAISEQEKSLLDQQAVSAALKEYKAVGADLPAMQMQYLVTTGAAMLGITALGMAFAIGIGFVAARTGATIGRDLRRKLFSQVVGFSEAEITKFSAASLITRGTNDIQLVQMVSILLLRMVLYAPILAIGGVVMVLVTNAQMGWIIAVAVCCVGAMIVLLMRITLPKFKIMQKLIDRVNLVSREMLTGLPVVRAFDRQPYEQARFDEANTRLLRTQLFTNRAMTFMMPVMMLIMNATSVAIVWFGGLAVGDGTIQTGDLIAFITYAMVIIMGFLMLGMIAIMLPRADVAAERINEVTSTKPSICDPEDGEAEKAEVEASVEPSDPMANATTNSEETQSNKGISIEFRNVSFRYDDGSECVLENVSFKVQPGETLAIVGGTGSGKSTVIKLIERFYDVSDGAVLVNGIDVRKLPQHELRKLFGYVPQKAFLFTGTIRSNVSYANNEMPESQIEEALDIAQAKAFVEAKAEGLDAEVSQGGTNVSGGQRQRLCIARAVAAQPKALLFDDSFSALDYKTDAALRTAIAQEMRGVTQVVVAQRISTIMYADQIVMLEEGKVVGLGTHEQLMSACEEYREMAFSQLSEEELADGGCAA